MAAYGLLMCRGVAVTRDEGAGRRMLACASGRGSAHASRIIDDIDRDAGEEFLSGASWRDAHSATFSAGDAVT
jgi:hypothetical protein